MDIRVPDSVIEIFCNHNCIASHRCLYSRKGQYSIVTEHISADHQAYLKWNDDHFRKWTMRNGTNTCSFVKAILTSQRVERQSYRSCMRLLKLAEKYSDRRLETTCKMRFPTQPPRATKASRTSWQPVMIGLIRNLGAQIQHQPKTGMPLLMMQTFKEEGILTNKNDIDKLIKIHLHLCQTLLLHR